MEDNWRKIVTKNRILWIFNGLLLLVWTLFGYTYLREYSYRYPAVQNYSVLFSKTIPNLLFSLIPLIIMPFCFLNKKVVLSLVCGAAFLVILPIAFWSSVGEFLYDPAICSHTEDIRNYGKYDDAVSEALSLHDVYLPKEVPSEAKNVHYYYHYEKASADTIYISVFWESTEDEIQKLKSNTEWETDEDQKTIIYLSEKSIPGNILQPYLKAVIILDETNNTIRYIVTNQEWDNQGQGDGSGTRGH